MGEYFIIPNKKGIKKKLLKWFDKHKPFYNDFGQENTFEDIFGDRLTNGDINFKIGVMDRKFYSKEAIKDIISIGAIANLPTMTKRRKRQLRRQLTYYTKIFYLLNRVAGFDNSKYVEIVKTLEEGRNYVKGLLKGEIKDD